jgi:RNA polymerase sigma-70 factor (ECF subfamily)
VSSLPLTALPAFPAEVAPADLPESDLVDRARAGDERAIRALYGRHARYVAGVVYRLMGNDAELDDIVQETFLDGLDALAALERPEALRAWLVTIAVRKAHKILARRRRRHVLHGLFRQFSAVSSDPRQGEPAFDLYEALEELPVDLRIPWTLSRVEQWTLPEVARACSVSLATVKRRISEAETRLARRSGEKS